jgi:catechol 2,3-dioxygenase-like lactoylglutathione lyase family enzyme
LRRAGEVQAMLVVGDLHIYVSDFVGALRFWSDGLGLSVVEKETTEFSAFARLESPSGGPSIRLFGVAEPWPEGERPLAGSRPTIRFDVMTDAFDETLVRLLENGGTQIDQIETYEGLRTVTIADPDANTFELVEVPPEEELAEDA